MKRLYLFGFLVFCLIQAAFTQPKGTTTPKSNGRYVIGRVVDDETGDYLKDVEISVFGESGRTNSLSDGSFSIFVVTANLCRLRFKHKGYIEEDGIDAPINDNSFRYTFRLQKTNAQRVSGRVVDANGNPLEGVEIVVNNVRPRIYLSDKDGFFYVYTPDKTTISIKARKNGYEDEDFIRAINAEFVMVGNIVLQRHISTPPVGRHIQVFEKSANKSAFRAPIKGVKAYVNNLEANTGHWGISNEKGYIIVNADPGDKITLKKDGFVTILNEAMPDVSCWILGMQPEPWLEIERFKEADLYMRGLLDQIYKVSNMPVQKGVQNIKLEQLLDSFKLGFVAIAQLGYIQDDSLDQVRRTQYFGKNGPFRVLHEYIKHEMGSTERWKEQRLFRENGLKRYEAAEKKVKEINKILKRRGEDDSVYEQIPELLQQAESACRDMITIADELQDRVGMNVTPIIQKNQAAFEASMTEINKVVQNELKDRPELAARIEAKAKQLAKSLADYAQWALE